MRSLAPICILGSLAWRAASGDEVISLAASRDTRSAAPVSWCVSAAAAAGTGFPALGTGFAAFYRRHSSRQSVELEAAAASAAAASVT